MLTFKAKLKYYYLNSTIKYTQNLYYKCPLTRSFILSSKRIIHTAKIVSCHKHTELIREFNFEMQQPSEFIFRAGQFLMIHIPASEGEKTPLRAYSIASGDQFKNSFRLLIKYVPNGIASEYFWKLSTGDDVKFTGPFGKLFFPQVPAQKLFFLSTGSGLAPHLSYIEAHLTQFPDSNFEFLIGVRTKQDFFFTEYLEQKKLQFPNFNFQFVLSRPDEHWNGRSGYLQTQIETLDINPEKSQFFICGNEEMAKSTKQALISAKLSPENIFVEIF